MTSKLPALMAALCAEAGLDKVFVSPGARSAPLLRAFSEHGAFKVSVLNDERAAAFIALGYTKGSGKPSILLCTSGSALLNYAPALAEADGSDLPLLILSADRPKENLGQFEGQTTPQDFIFRPWTRLSIALEEADYERRYHWCVRTLNVALDALWGPPSGPVHANIHLNEPLFSQPIFPAVSGLRIRRQANQPQLQQYQNALSQILDTHPRVLALAGSRLGLQPAGIPQFAQALMHMGVPVLAENQAFGVTAPGTISNAEDILRCHSGDDRSHLTPDALITWGGNIVGKKTKLFLKESRPCVHIHVDPAGRPVDMFGCLTDVWTLSPWTNEFHFPDFSSKLKPETRRTAYLRVWQEASAASARRFRKVLENLPFGDFTAVDTVVRSLSANALLHTGNSMPLRYMISACGHSPAPVIFDVNRGVSGIDGTLGTAIGLALSQPSTPVWCLIGDLSFHHGVNALWQSQVPPNLRIVILNNGGGNIFGIIPGPDQTPDPKHYFENRASSTARWDAQKFGLHYFSASSMQALISLLPAFTDAGKAAILEIFTDPDVNISAFKKFEQLMTSDL